MNDVSDLSASLPIITPVKGMNKRDASSPNENKAPGITMQDDANTSACPAKKPRLVEGRIAVSGRVASVRLINFMCHANLEIDFNTKENNCFYIGGPNGSGKSALFAAINLGLGGRGSDNDRGNTVKSYIKDGTTQAKITITLTNEGLNSHPDLDSLVSVERTINQSSSTYVMKSIKVSPSGHHTERVISKKKSDIDRIVNRFNIHLSNPAFWMSQDRSRSFLANFKPSNVYKLYLESTNLENIFQSYCRFSEAVEECAELVENKQREIAKEHKKLKEMQEQRALQQRIDSDMALIKVYKWKLIFCKVRDYDDDLEHNLKLQEVHKRVYEECKKEYAENRTTREAVQKNIQNVCDEVEVQKDELDEANERKNEKSKAVMMLNEKINNFERQITRKKGDIRAVNQAIEDADKRYRTLMAKQGNKKLAEKLKTVESDYHRLTEERDNMEMGGEMDRLKDKFELIQKDMKMKEEANYTTKRSIRKLHDQINERQDIIRRARAAKSDSVNKFGNRMSEILTEVNRNKSTFAKMPKGPLGKFITLTDSKWAFAVEECLHNVSNSFLCHSQKDAVALREIFNRLRLHLNDRPAIIVSAFTNQRYPKLQEPDCEYPSMFRILQISDADVENILIDKTNFEQFILIEQKTEAMKIMGSNNPPHNASRAFTLDGSQAYANGPNSQYRFYAGRPGRASGLFGSTQTNVDEATLTREINDMKAEVSDLESKTSVLETEYTELKKDSYVAKKAIEDFERKLSNIRSEERKHQRLFEDIKSEMAQATNEDQLESIADSITELKNKIPVVEQELQGIQQQLDEANRQMRPAMAEKKEAEDVLAEMKQETQDLLQRMQKLHADLASFDDSGDLLQVRLNKMKGEEQTIFHNEAKLKTEKDEAQQLLEQNKLTTEMPPTEQDPPDLSDFPITSKAEAKLAELQRTTKLASLGCDKSITNDTVKEFKDKLKSNKFFCRNLEESVASMRELSEARFKTYPLLKKWTDVKVCDKFQELLEIRGHFIGGLEFDHEKRTLNVNVQSCKDKDAMADRRNAEGDNIDDEEEEEEENSGDSDDSSDAPRKKKAKKQPKKKKVRDLKGLSGGERSFVTAALVMSLWEVMEQPFRMLDEFDVFMDMMNRKLVMDLLVELATQKFPHNQFIFFTPQGIKELKMVNGLQVFEMNKVRD
ncbi:CRE-SMC-6 protein [Caenorhabditis remanei]|uniref:CRE-SMC-6 protein n=1 Tax=Caenorhabditis remanei TaxID=31234 RepID=E3LF56_CAERE|nr:CRE-SMC-6 protein [Caenorhabditis remanei]